MASNTQPVPEAPQAAATQEAPKAPVSLENETGLRDYELVVIVTPDATEEKLDARLNTISQFVTGHGGSVVSMDKWGKRRLAYPVKKHFEGFYVLYKLILPPGASRELEASLRITEDVIRYLLVKTGE
jgi:small subunit ribosomal protein S6